jgi:hypothetical protein
LATRSVVNSLVRLTSSNQAVPGVVPDQKPSRAATVSSVRSPEATVRLTSRQSWLPSVGAEWSQVPRKLRLAPASSDSGDLATPAVRTHPDSR